MGKKSKANRKKTPVATSATTAVAATAAVAASASATTTAAVAVATSAVSATSAAAAAARRTGTVTEYGEFPKSTFFVKGESFLNKGNFSKASKLYLQGIENNACVRCLNAYAWKLLFDGRAKQNIAEQMCNDNIYLHLALPLALESAIRGNTDAMIPISDIYHQTIHETDGSTCSRYECHSHPAMPLTLYWRKIGLKHYGRENKTLMKQYNKDVKEIHGTKCSVCGKEDSETVTLLKCDGCKFYYYCSKECQQKMWQEGQHAGVCRQLGLLKKYHKPFANKIRRDIAVHRIAPQDIPELQELRQRLGLSRPQADYQELLDGAQAQRLDSTQLILPRKDGTVQIGSFPRPF